MSYYQCVVGVNLGVGDQGVWFQGFNRLLHLGSTILEDRLNLRLIAGAKRRRLGLGLIRRCPGQMHRPHRDLQHILHAQTGDLLSLLPGLEGARMDGVHRQGLGGVQRGNEDNSAIERSRDSPIQSSSNSAGRWQIRLRGDSELAARFFLTSSGMELDKESVVGVDSVLGIVRSGAVTDGYIPCSWGHES